MKMATEDLTAKFALMPLRDDNPSRIDLLGFEDIVTAVESTVTRLDLDPITVGINAPWGGGKTTVLQLLLKKLSARTDLLAVYVSPWEFDAATDTKSALIGLILSRLQSELKGEQSAVDSVLGKLSRLRKRLNTYKAVRVAAKSALSMTLPSYEDLESLFDEEKGVEPTLQGFKDQFASLLQESALSHIDQVIVLIDDLDRALPDAVVDTLEAIKLFLSVDKMAFVIAADDDAVERAIAQRLAFTRQSTTARQYLEKIVQIPFRIPALSLDRTAEYLLLLLLDKLAGFDARLAKIVETRGNGDSLAVRLAGLVPEGHTRDVELAERLAPILYRHTQGNPRRLKRFLNALWLRTVFADARRVMLSPDACAKLMIAELLYPDLFSQMLGWLAASSLSEQIAALEKGEGDFPSQTLDWGQLEPPLTELDLAPYFLLAASLRGESVEQAALPPELRTLALQLGSDSHLTRDAALAAAGSLSEQERSILTRSWWMCGGGPLPGLLTNSPIVKALLVWSRPAFMVMRSPRIQKASPSPGLSL
jgi:hypothetical protein